MTPEESAQPSADERMATIPDPPTTAVQRLRRRDSSKTILLIFASMGMALGVMGAAIALGSRDEFKADAQQSSAKVAQLEPQVQVLTENQGNLKSGLDEANRRLIAGGKAPVPVPTVAPTTPLPQVDEFTAEEAAAVRVIVADQISRQKVTITQAEISQIARIAAALVPKPKDGSTPTAAQLQPIVTATLAAYCVDDKCVGAKGDEGDTGPKGDPGERGEQGPKVTDEELLAASTTALAAYCGQESQPCKGDKGDAGERGPAGVGITDMDCVGTGDDSLWRIYLSNGTTKDVPGPCRIQPLLPTAPPS